MQKRLKFNFKLVLSQILTSVILTFSLITNALDGQITVNSHSYTVIKEIARGGEGTVYEVQDTQSPHTKYALKVQKISVINPYDPINPNHQMEFYDREFKFDFFKNRVKNLPHHVKKIFKYMPFTFDYLIHLPEQEFRDSAKPNIQIRSGVSLMSLADDTLYAHIQTLNQKLDLTSEQQQKARSDLALSVFKDILHELKTLSENSYAYLDLKPFNIGFDAASNTYSLLDLNSIYSTIPGEDISRTILATVVYAAPEINNSNKYSEISQLYSLAMTLLEILDSNFVNHIRYKLMNKNDTHFDQQELLRIERLYMNSFAHVDRVKLVNLFSFLKAATEKDPYVRSQKLCELTFSSEIDSVVTKADIRQSRVSTLMESLKAKLKNTRNASYPKMSCDGLFQY